MGYNLFLLIEIDFIIEMNFIIGDWNANLVGGAAVDEAALQLRGVITASSKVCTQLDTVKCWGNVWQ